MKQNHDLLMRSLGKFYGVDENIDKVVHITEGKADISLRMIDWFVTNYAKKRNIIHKRGVSNNSAPKFNGNSNAIQLKEGPDRVSYFSVYLSYREELRTYSKQQFDPFRRNDHIVFRYGDGGALETTVGQLNFFRWAIENGILDYIRDHRSDIEESMSGKASASARETSSSIDDSRKTNKETRDGSSKGAVRAKRYPVVLSVRSMISFD